MFVIAKGSITRPDALAPHLDDEMRVLRDLKADGVIKSAYRRSAGPGFYFILEGHQHRISPRTNRHHPTVRHREPRDARLRRDLRNLNPDRATAASPVGSSARRTARCDIRNRPQRLTQLADPSHQTRKAHHDNVPRGPNFLTRYRTGSRRSASDRAWPWRRAGCGGSMRHLPLRLLVRRRRVARCAVPGHTGS